jgi:hypothetical protein
MHDAFEDVELESGYSLTIMDSSRPLLIDITPRIPMRSVLKFIAVELLVVLFVSLCAPKDHFVDYSIYRVARHHLEMPQTYDFHFTHLNRNFTKVWLSLFAIRGIERPRNYDNISWAVDAKQFASSLLVSHTQQRKNSAMFHYHPRHHRSDVIDCLSIPINASDRIDVTATLTYHSPFIEAVIFEWSMNNPNNPVLESRSYLWFGLISVLLAGLLLRNCRRRTEQTATLVNLLLFLVSSYCFASDSLIFHFVESLMVAHMRGFLFYMVAYIANKHRNFVTEIGFALIFMSFAFDIAIAWHSWKTKILMMHVHDILMHLLLICACESMIGAMYFTAEDHFSFALYTVLLSLSFAATVLAHDWCILSPHFEHYVEPRIAFYGIHAIILTVLVYFHQGMTRTESDGDKLDDEPSSDLAMMVST